MGYILTTASQLACPHGGTVAPATADAQASVGGAYALLATDPLTIAGCPFTLPGPPPVPHPCVTVQWQTTALRVTVSGAAVLTDQSVGLCLAADQAPQGTIVIQPAQQQAEGT